MKNKAEKWILAQEAFYMSTVFPFFGADKTKYFLGYRFSVVFNFKQKCLKKKRYSIRRGDPRADQEEFPIQVFSSWKLKSLLDKNSYEDVGAKVETLICDLSKLNKSIYSPAFHKKVSKNKTV